VKTGQSDVVDDGCVVVGPLFLVGQFSGSRPPPKMCVGEGAPKGQKKEGERAER
jgi:hypothetical protein